MKIAFITGFMLFANLASAQQSRISTAEDLAKVCGNIQLACDAYFEGVYSAVYHDVGFFAGYMYREGYWGGANLGRAFEVRGVCGLPSSRDAQEQALRQLFINASNGINLRKQDALDYALLELQIAAPCK